MATGRVSSGMIDAPADSTPHLKNQQPSRRLTQRIASTPDLWVYWHSEIYGDLSRVRDLSVGGLLIETSQTIPVGGTMALSFLVLEGQIRVHALVRYLKLGFGLGLKLTAITAEDRPRYAALLARIRVSSESQDQGKQADRLPVVAGKQVAQWR